MDFVQHVFIIGAKGLGNYGGYETFLDKLTEYHQENKLIKYHIACKANGAGFMDETKLEHVTLLSDVEFVYHNAHCFKLYSPNFGAAQAVLYDVIALHYCCNYIKVNCIKSPIVYILSSRVGPFISYFSNKIHELGGQYWNNPDGRESLRKKYHPLIRRYWKLSEKLMIRFSDLIVCDSINIERYIHEEYSAFSPKTTYIAYGADTKKSTMPDNDSVFLEWLKNNNLQIGQYYMSCGRFVPENNFEIMIREFMMSDTDKSFAVITNINKKFLSELEQKLHFEGDSRIKFVGTVYDRELLKKIRENAYAYFHGHEVGGTNPSLLEALSSTNLNLLLDVGFNQEVAQDSAFYWSKETGVLANLIQEVDKLSQDEMKELGHRAKQRIAQAYDWEYISDMYLKQFLSQVYN